MSRLLIIGCGGVAQVAIRKCCQNSEVFTEIMIASRTKSKCDDFPVWKPMHKQPVYKDAPAYINGVSEAIFKIGMCLPAGPWVTDEDVYYIVECIKEAIVK